VEVEVVRGGVNIRWRRMDLHLHASSKVMAMTAHDTVLSVAVNGIMTNGERNQFVPVFSRSEYRSWVLIPREH
jgi:hypothetical protein